jgi:hypothetical protein
MLKANPNLISARNSIGETVLHHLAVENYVSAVKWMIDEGFDVNCKNEFGEPAFFEVAHLGYTELLDLMLDAGADITAQTNLGDDIWYYLKEFGCHDMIKYLNTKFKINDATQFIKSLTEDEIWFIAGLDYKADLEKHYSALKKVLVRNGNIEMATENWFPYEVIELGANDLIPGHQREFTACLLIVMMNIKFGTDKTKDLDQYISDRLDFINSLGADLKNLIIDGI